MKKHNKSNGIIYSFYHLKSEFFKVENWYFDTRNICVVAVKRNAITVESKQKHFNYITLFENNRNFAFITEDSDKITLNKINTIKISGEKSKGLNLIIYILEYDQNHSLVNKIKISLNKLETFSAHENGRYIRIAIRIEGVGKLHITNLFTSPFAPIKKQKSMLSSTRFTRRINVACILDDYNRQGFSNVLNVNTLTDNWENQLLKSTPDFLLVDSSWSWTPWLQNGKKTGIAYDEKYDLLSKCVLWCNTNNIPTVYWDNVAIKEINETKKVISMFDYVFTINSDMVAQFKEYIEHDRIYFMMHAAQPRLDQYNSLSSQLVLFTKKKQDERIESQYDEQFQTKDKIHTICKPGIVPRELLQALAHGIPVISEQEPTIKKIFHRTIQIARNSEEMNRYVKEMKTDKRLYLEASLTGIRDIFRKHTFEHRANFILDKLSIPYKTPIRNVTLLFSIESKDDFYKAYNIIQKQSYKRLRPIILISLFDGYEGIFNTYNNQNIAIYIKEYALEHYSFKDLVTTNYFTLMNPNIDYGKYFVEDAIYAVTNLQSEIVWKNPAIDTDRNDMHTPFISGENHTITAYSAVMKSELLASYTLQEIMEKQSEILVKLAGSNDR